MEMLPILGEGYSSNVYLINGNQKILIDAGLGTDAYRIIRSIEGTAKKLDAIILTHRHMDHIGGAKQISEHFNAEIYASEIECKAISDGDMKSTCAFAFGMKVPKIKVRTIDELECGEIQVIPTPGHTSGSISIYFPSKKWLFSGDTVFLYGSTGRWDLPTGNLEDLKRSIEMLSTLEIEGLFPGHEGYTEREGIEHIHAALEFLRGEFFE
ncbi:MAG: MBL fold metallo-hydrolase [Thermoplasmata archaeon]